MATIEMYYKNWSVSVLLVVAIIFWIGLLSANLFVFASVMRTKKWIYFTDSLSVTKFPQPGITCVLTPFVFLAGLHEVSMSFLQAFHHNLQNSDNDWDS